ncbi:transcription factor VIP1-like [Magnolia sinica]|uniref:transcription factor VIP1-like n=1 Tax=Magnolia sinica TaxID=86752 RepID=UPI00265A444C|nr:transcription factor VIP1-like [Magnolia sinica]
MEAPPPPPNYSETSSAKPYFGRYIGRNDLDQMPETPRRGSHRRAHSDTSFRLPDDDDDILFDAADTDFSLADIDIPTLSLQDSAFPTHVDSSAAKSEESNGRDDSSSRPVGNISNHFRSLSVDAAFFEGLGFQPLVNGGEGQGEKPGAGGRGVQEKRMHRHSNSMDGSSSSFEADSLSDYTKKAMAADKLAELALIDPKRAKRILANRQSAARSKERKIRYTSELERKVQTLQTEATTLSAQLTLLQRDTTGLTAENKELKLRLQAMEQQAHLRDALNEALREEVQRLKIATGQVQNVNNNAFNRVQQQSAPAFFSHPQQLHHLVGSQQTQQLHMSQSSPNRQSPQGQGSSDFNYL